MPHTLTEAGRTSCTSFSVPSRGLRQATLNMPDMLGVPTWTQLNSSSIRAQPLTCRARLLALQWSMASSTVFTRMMGTTGPNGSSHAMRIFCKPANVAEVMQRKDHLLSWHEERQWNWQSQAALQLQWKQRTWPQQVGLTAFKFALVQCKDTCDLS